MMNKNNKNTSMQDTQQKTAKIMQIVMLCMILFSGFFLPVAMAIYWTISALITLGQSLIVQLIVANHSKKSKGEYIKYKTK